MSIYFATPCYGGMQTVPFTQSCERLQFDLNATNFNYDWDKIFNESLVTRARNIQASNFYFNTEFEALMFIDADIEFSSDDVGKLWEMNEGVCAGAYARKQKGETAKVWLEEKEVPVSELTDNVSVDYAGTGFMLIRRWVFEKLHNLHPEWERRNGEVIAFFQDDGCDMSEDYFFCEQWRNAGGEIIVDPSIHLKHWGFASFGD